MRNDFGSRPYSSRFPYAKKADGGSAKKQGYNARLDEWIPVKDRCQFSWYCDGLHDKPNSGRTWENAKELASLVMQKYQRRILIDITDGATHYHANWMHTYPKWSYEHKKVASIDRHIFYRANTRNGR